MYYGAETFEKLIMKNIDQEEVSKFDEIAEKWWDLEGEFKPLHQINPLRVGFINERTTLKGAKVLDIGCGEGSARNSGGYSKTYAQERKEGFSNMQVLDQKQPTKPPVEYSADGLPRTSTKLNFLVQPFPIRNTFVPQVGHVPWVAGLPFLRVT